MKGSKEGVHLVFNFAVQSILRFLCDKKIAFVFLKTYACGISDLKKMKLWKCKIQKWKGHVFMSSYSVDPCLSDRTL